MRYKNSIKIVFSNFHLVWQVVFYFACVFAVCVGGLYLLLNPVVMMFQEAGLVEHLVDMYSTFITSLNLAQLAESLVEFWAEIKDFALNNFDSFWINCILSLFLILFLFVVLNSLVHMALCHSLHYYIGSLTKQGFFLSFGEVLGKNIKFQLCRYLVVMPINALFTLILFVAFDIFGSSILLNVVAVALIVVLLGVLMTLKYVLFSSWAPTMIVMNYGIWKSLRVSLKNAFRNFGKIFSCALGVVVTVFILNMLMGVFTFFVGLLLSVPISFLIYNAFGMVCVYEAQGMRYYVDIYNVITPKKKEQLDKIGDMKYII